MSHCSVHTGAWAARHAQAHSTHNPTHAEQYVPVLYQHAKVRPPCSAPLLRAVLTRVRGLRDMHKRISADLKKAEEHHKHYKHNSTGRSNSSNPNSPPAAGDTIAAGAGSSSSSTMPAAKDADAAGRSPAKAAAAAAEAADADDAEQVVYIERLTALLASSGATIERMQVGMP